MMMASVELFIRRCALYFALLICARLFLLMTCAAMVRRGRAQALTTLRLPAISAKLATVIEL